MYQNERELEIRKILLQKGYASVQELSQWLYTSPSSVRRDLASLEKQGLVKRSYGGAEPVKNSSQILPFSTRAHQNILAKKAMARKAVSMGEKIAMIATVPTTEGPSSRLIMHEAEKINKEIELDGINAFDGKTVALCIGADGYIALYLDGEYVSTSPWAITETIAVVGHNSGALNPCTISGCRIYEGVL